MAAWIFEVIVFCSCQWDCSGVLCVLTSPASSWAQGWFYWPDFHSYRVYHPRKFGERVFRRLFPKQRKRVWTRWDLQSLLTLKLCGGIKTAQSQRSESQPHYSCWPVWLVSVNQEAGCQDSIWEVDSTGLMWRWVEESIFWGERWLQGHKHNSGLSPTFSWKSFYTLRTFSLSSTQAFTKYSALRLWRTSDIMVSLSLLPPPLSPSLSLPPSPVS